MPYPRKEVRPQPCKEPMRRNQVQRVIQPHPCLRHQIRRRLHHRQQRQPLLQNPHCIPLATAILAPRQVLLQSSRKLIRQLTIVRQNDVLLCHFTLHRTTSTSLEILLPLGSIKPPVLKQSQLISPIPSPSL